MGLAALGYLEAIGLGQAIRLELSGDCPATNGIVLLGYRPQWGIDSRRTDRVGSFEGSEMNKFSEDVARYRADGASTVDILFRPTIWVIAIYRLRNWVYVANPPWLIRTPLRVICVLANMFFEVFMAMEISPRASIGGGLCIGHVGGLVISKDAVIGRNFDVGQRVTIGASAGGREGAPTIGDNVYIGIGATVTGKIRIGNGAKISANTLVINDVPEGATVMGVPGRVFFAPPAAAPSPSMLDAERPANNQVPQEPSRV